MNIGKWVMRNLFHGFVREEQRAHRDASHHRLQRSSAPTHIDLNGHSQIIVDSRQRSSSDASRTSSVAALSPRSSAVVSSPTMLPAVSPSVTAVRSSPLMTPYIPLSVSARDSSLSPIPQSPATVDMTPMPHRPQTADPTTGVPIPPAHRDDYFSVRTRRGSLSTNSPQQNPTTPDDFSSWSGKASSIEAPVPQTPNIPSGGLIGRIMGFSKSTKRHTNETGGITSPTTPGIELAETHVVSLS